MKTTLEESLELEDRIRVEVQARFPDLDPDWAVDRWFTKMNQNSRKMVESVVLMEPEIHRLAVELRRANAKA